VDLATTTPVDPRLAVAPFDVAVMVDLVTTTPVDPGLAAAPYGVVVVVDLELAVAPFGVAVVVEHLLRKHEEVHPADFLLVDFAILLAVDQQLVIVVDGVGAMDCGLDFAGLVAGRLVVVVVVGSPPTIDFSCCHCAASRFEVHWR
jgi:hypothetical protein